VIAQDVAHGVNARAPDVAVQVEIFERHVLKPGLLFKGKGLKPVAFKLRGQHSSTDTVQTAYTLCRLRRHCTQYANCVDTVHRPTPTQSKRSFVCTQ
jgi:hypothetical protein